ncbi:MAG: hypothetical protein AB4426_16315 [Xenococcaceae cyanobacterium]
MPYKTTYWWALPIVTLWANLSIGTPMPTLQNYLLVGIADCYSLGKSFNWHPNTHPQNYFLTSSIE